MHNNKDILGYTNYCESENVLNSRLFKIDENSSFNEVKYYANRLKEEFLEKVSKEIVEFGPNSMFSSESELIEFNYHVDYLDKIANAIHIDLLDKWCDYAVDEEKKFMTELKVKIQQKRDSINLQR